jgi:hypothetical protein
MFYPELPPVINARSEESIYSSLVELIGDQDQRDRIGVSGRKWVEKYCSPEVATSNFIHLFEEVLKNI